MRKMSLEQMDHVLRHVEMHANEFRHGNFTKGGDYLKKLKEAQGIWECRLLIWYNPSKWLQASSLPWIQKIWLWFFQGSNQN